MTFHLACIVEGQGEVEALPILVRRITGNIAPEVVVRIPIPCACPGAG